MAGIGSTSFEYATDPQVPFIYSRALLEFAILNPGFRWGAAVVTGHDRQRRGSVVASGERVH